MGSKVSTSPAHLKVFLIQSPRFCDYRAIVRAENENEALLCFAEQTDLHDSPIPLHERFSAWETHVADGHQFRTIILDRELINQMIAKAEGRA